MPHSDGYHRLLPVLKWRTVGAMCGLTATESDNIVAELSDMQVVRVWEPNEHTFSLTSGREIASELLDKRRRRLWNCVILLAFAVYASARLFVTG